MENSEGANGCDKDQYNEYVFCEYGKGNGQNQQDFQNIAIKMQIIQQTNPGSMNENKDENVSYADTNMNNPYGKNVFIAAPQNLPNGGNNVPQLQSAIKNPNSAMKGSGGTAANKVMKRVQFSDRDMICHYDPSNDPPFNPANNSGPYRQAGPNNNTYERDTKEGGSAAAGGGRWIFGGYVDPNFQQNNITHEPVLINKRVINPMTPFNPFVGNMANIINHGPIVDFGLARCCPEPNIFKNDLAFPSTWPRPILSGNFPVIQPERLPLRFDLNKNTLNNILAAPVRGIDDGLGYQKDIFKRELAQCPGLNQYGIFKPLDRFDPNNQFRHITNDMPLINLPNLIAQPIENTALDANDLCFKLELQSSSSSECSEDEFPNYRLHKCPAMGMTARKEEPSILYEMFQNISQEDLENFYRRGNLPHNMVLRHFYPLEPIDEVEEEPEEKPKAWENYNSVPNFNNVALINSNRNFGHGPNPGCSQNADAPAQNIQVQENEPMTINSEANTFSEQKLQQVAFDSNQPGNIYNNIIAEQKPNGSNEAIQYITPGTIINPDQGTPFNPDQRPVHFTREPINYSLQERRLVDRRREEKRAKINFYLKEDKFKKDSERKLPDPMQLKRRYSVQELVQIGERHLKDQYELNLLQNAQMYRQMSSLYYSELVRKIMTESALVEKRLNETIDIAIDRQCRGLEILRKNLGLLQTFHSHAPQVPMPDANIPQNIGWQPNIPLGGRM